MKSIAEKKFQELPDVKIIEKHILSVQGTGAHHANYNVYSLDSPSNQHLLRYPILQLEDDEDATALTLDKAIKHYLRQAAKQKYHQILIPFQAACFTVDQKQTSYQVGIVIDMSSENAKVPNKITLHNPHSREKQYFTKLEANTENLLEVQIKQAIIDAFSKDSTPPVKPNFEFIYYNDGVSRFNASDLVNGYLNNTILGYPPTKFYSKGTIEQTSAAPVAKNTASVQPQKEKGESIGSTSQNQGQKPAASAKTTSKTSKQPVDANKSPDSPKATKATQSSSTSKPASVKDDNKDKKAVKKGSKTTIQSASKTEEEKKQKGKKQEEKNTNQPPAQPKPAANLQQPGQSPEGTDKFTSLDSGKTEKYTYPIPGANASASYYPSDKQPEIIIEPATFWNNYRRYMGYIFLATLLGAGLGASLALTGYFIPFGLVGIGLIAANAGTVAGACLLIGTILSIAHAAYRRYTLNISCQIESSAHQSANSNWAFEDSQESGYQQKKQRLFDERPDNSDHDELLSNPSGNSEPVTTSSFSGNTN